MLSVESCFLSLLDFFWIFIYKTFLPSIPLLEETIWGAFTSLNSPLSPIFHQLCINPLPGNELHILSSDYRCVHASFLFFFAFSHLLMSFTEQ